MQAKIVRVVMSGVGIATLAALSVFATKGTDQASNNGLSAKANGHAGKIRLACGRSGEPACTGTVVGGVRG